MSEEQKTETTDIQAETPATAAPAEQAAAEVRETKTETTEAKKPAQTQEREHRGGNREHRGGRDNRRGDQRLPKFRKKVCRFCHDKNAEIDYKRPEVLEKFITDRGKILPRRVTGTCAKHQRAVAKAIKSARMIALLPFIEK